MVGTLWRVVWAGRSRKARARLPAVMWLAGWALWYGAGLVGGGWSVVVFGAGMGSAVLGIVIGWRYRNGDGGGWAWVGGLQSAGLLALAMAVFVAAATGTVAGLLNALSWIDEQIVGLGDVVAALDVAVLSLFVAGGGASLVGMFTLFRLGMDALPSEVEERREAAVDVLPALTAGSVMATGLYVVLRATESSVWRGVVGMVAAAAAVLAWVSPALVALLLWWVWVARRGAKDDPRRDDGSGMRL